MADEPTAQDPDSKAKEFERQVMQPQRGIVGEFVDFLLHNKKWWLTPIIVVLLLVGLLLAVANLRKWCAGRWQL